MRSFLFALAAAALLLAGGVALRLMLSRSPGLRGCPVAQGGHPSPVPLAGSYFQTGTVDGHWGDHFPGEVGLDLPLLKKGEALYARDCRTCHGALGLGDGVMTRLPEGPRGVASLQGGDALTRADGNLFAIVTRGKGKMIGYGDTIPAADRWAIVAYVRALQLSQSGVRADAEGAAPADWEENDPTVYPADPALGAPTPAEARRLNTFGWIDRKAGTIHLPMYRALPLALARLQRGQAAGPVAADPATSLP